MIPILCLFQSLTSKLRVEIKKHETYGAECYYGCIDPSVEHLSEVYVKNSDSVCDLRHPK